MAETPLILKKTNRIPALESTLEENGVAVNLETPIKAVAVKLIIKPPAGAAKTLVAEFVVAKNGTVRYKWTKADTESGGAIFTAGAYKYEWQVEWAAGETENFPLSGSKELTVEAELE